MRALWVEGTECVCELPSTLTLHCKRKGANFELRIANRTGEGTEKCGEVVVQ